MSSFIRQSMNMLKRCFCYFNDGVSSSYKSVRSIIYIIECRRVLSSLIDNCRSKTPPCKRDCYTYRHNRRNNRWLSNCVGVNVIDFFVDFGGQLCLKNPHTIERLSFLSLQNELFTFVPTILGNNNTCFQKEDGSTSVLALITHCDVYQVLD